MIDNALDLMLVLGPDGVILRANGAAQVLLGYAPGELLGQHYTALLPPEQHAEALEVQASLQSGHPERPDFPMQVRRRDGQVILMAAAVRWSAAHQRIFLSARDATERQRARQALVRSEMALNSMLESIGDAFFAVDDDWRLTYANQKAGDFVGIDAGGALGRGGHPPRRPRSAAR